MNSKYLGKIALACGICISSALATEKDSPEWKPEVIEAHMDKLAQWQIKHMNHKNVDWLHGALYAGMAAYGNMNPENIGFESIRQVGQLTGWGVNPLTWHADEHCIGQGYIELAIHDRNPYAVNNIKTVLDDIIAQNHQNPLEFTKENQKRWNWVDALFMSPTVFTKLYGYTGDEKYLNFIDREIKTTYDFLYDKDSHLFYRDSRYFPEKQKTPSGQKMFWSRGNGWAFAALATILTDCPQDRPARQFYESVFKDMAVSVKNAQQPDGSWHPSMLDPANPNIIDMSASMFLTYGLMWGVNNGLLSEDEYVPVIQKAWVIACKCLREDGALGWVQPVADKPFEYEADSTTVYGSGAFLLAASEIHKYVIRRDNIIGMKTVTVSNPVSLFRQQDTVTISWDGEESTNTRVFDWRNGRVIPHQFIDSNNDGKVDSLLFQADILAKSTRTFYIFNSTTLPAAKTEEICFSRYVPERMDDFAWENDMAAYRTYGPMVSQPAPKGEGLISSGIDIWCKRVKYPIINKFYKSADYHNDNGEGVDFYKVGTGRGCGGMAVFKNGKLYTSRNWEKASSLYSGPIRTAFVLEYAPFDVNGVKVAEKRLVTLDAGSFFARSESTLTITGDASGLTYGPGLDVSEEHNHKGDILKNDDKGIVATWNKPDANNGIIGTAIIVPDGKNVSQDGHEFMVVPAVNGKTATWFSGSTWDRAGYIRDYLDWEDAAEHYATGIASPLAVSVK